MAFNKVKEAITKNQLSRGDRYIQFHLTTDASTIGTGGILF